MLLTLTLPRRSALLMALNAQCGALLVAPEVAKEVDDARGNAGRLQ